MRRIVLDISTVYGLIVFMLYPGIKPEFKTTFIYLFLLAYLATIWKIYHIYKNGNHKS